MADKKITQFDTASTITGEEIVPLVQGGINVKATLSVLAAFFGAGTGSSSVTATINCNGVSTIFNLTVSHGGNGVLWSMKASQDNNYDQSPLVSYPDNNTIRIDISTLDFSSGKSYKFKYIV
jgi:hypothetical protein